ncbi:M24 family metallopeptidase [Candidatus Hydrogenedentota bacterium]
MSIQDRLDRLRANFDEAGVDVFFSIDECTNHYLSGFSGSNSGIVIGKSEAVFYTDFRYTEQAAEQVSSKFERRETKAAVVTDLAEAIKEIGAGKAAFEPDKIKHGIVLKLGELVPDTELVPVTDWTARMRVIKTEDEVARIRKSAEITDKALGEALGVMRDGMTERELSAEISYRLKLAGADKEAFDVISLFGARSSLPHGTPSDKALEAGELVLVDMGARLDGYNSDLTRTFVWGRMPNDEIRSIYDVVGEAQSKALDVISAGLDCKEADAAARKIIEDAGYANTFGHGLGHGVGLEVHEKPHLSPRSTEKLEEGMVVTVEPGIYCPGLGGVRIEDLVVVAKDGCEILSSFGKEWRIL